MQERMDEDARLLLLKPLEIMQNSQFSVNIISCHNQGEDQVSGEDQAPWESSPEWRQRQDNKSQGEKLKTKQEGNVEDQMSWVKTKALEKTMDSKVKSKS